MPDVHVYKGKRAVGGLKAGDRHLVDDVNCPFVVMFVQCVLDDSGLFVTITHNHTECPIDRPRYFLVKSLFVTLLQEVFDKFE